MNQRADRIDTLGLMLTTRCNLNCSYCYQHGHRQHSARWQDLRRSLDWALLHSGSQLLIIMSGGEPLLVPDMVHRIVDHTRRNAPADLTVSYRIMTNGKLLDEETFVALARHKVEIRLSCDGTPAAQALRSDDSFAANDVILDRLARADSQAFQDQLLVVMTVLPETVPHLTDGVAYLLQKGVAQIEMGPVLTACPGWDRADLTAMSAEFQRLRELCLVHYQRTGEVPLRLLRRWDLPPSFVPVQPAGCNALRTRNPVADVDGRWYSCGLFMPSTSQPEHVAPGVSDTLCWGRPGSAEFEFHTEDHAARMSTLPVFRERPERTGLFGPCSDCDHRQSCHICPLVFLPAQRHSTAPRVPDFVCAFNALAHEANQAFPSLPTPPEWRLHPQFLAQQEAAFARAVAKLNPAPTPPPNSAGV